MLNITFGDSECGMIKFALKGESTLQSHRLLGYGQIHPDHFEEGRRAWIDAFFAACTKRTREKIWQEDLARFQKILDTAKEEKQLRIWYASNPHTKCGFYHLIYSLKDVDCTVYVVEMPEYLGFREPSYDKFWGEADPFEVGNCLKLQRQLTSEERARFAQLWEKLAMENEELRLNVNGQITSLPVDYIDDEILLHAPQSGNISIGKLVGETLGKSKHYLCDSFVAYRVEAMIDRGILTVVEDTTKPEDYYKTIIRLSTEEDKQERNRRFDFVVDFLRNLGIDMYAIGNAIDDEHMQNSYALIMANPKMTKKQALKKLKLEEYVSNPIPHKYRDYGEN